MVRSPVSPHVLYGPPGVHAALCALIFSYYDHSLEYLSKEMWRSAMALSIEASQPPTGRHYTELDQWLAIQVTDLISALQERGDVRADVDPAALGRVIFNNLNQMFIEFVKDDDATLSDLRDTVAKQMRPISNLIASGAER